MFSRASAFLRLRMVFVRILNPFPIATSVRLLVVSVAFFPFSIYSRPSSRIW